MKNIIEFLNEAADKSYKELFGRTITFSDSMRSFFSKLNMDFRHIYDKFVIYEDGCLEYRNEHLFTGCICAKIYSHNLNRFISYNDKTLKVYANDSFSHMDPPVLDMKDMPRNYMKAIYNALTHKSYTNDGCNIKINNIDYTSGDFKKDKE